MRTYYRIPHRSDNPSAAERDQLLSGCVDALTVVIEAEDDRRLRMARELVLNAALPPAVVILIDREELDR